MKRYKLANDKTLVDTREDKTYVFEKVRAERRGRITSAIFKLHDGSEFKMALHHIDQNGHDLGLGVAPAKIKLAAKKADPVPTTGTAMSGPYAQGGVLLLIPRDELLQIHSALQSAADITLRRVVESLR